MTLGGVAELVLGVRAQRYSLDDVASRWLERVLERAP